jgi:hypothetical protein
MADEDTQTGSQTDTAEGLPAQEPADPNAYPELAPVEVAPPLDHEAAAAARGDDHSPSDEYPAVGEPAPEIPAPAAVDAQDAPPAEDTPQQPGPFRLPPMHHPRWDPLKKWIRDEIELMQLGKSRQSREDFHNP